MQEYFECYKNCYKKYFIFSGRSSRQEYVVFTLVNLVLSIVVSQMPIASSLLALVTIIPSISVSVRRLHDLNTSGWLLLFPCGIMIIGFILSISFPADLGLIIALIIVAIGGISSLVLALWMLFFRGTVGINRYGSE